MALVLCTGVDKALLQTRQYILEAEGHTVVTATDENTLRDACKERAFDVGIIGHSTGAKAKRRIYALLREHCPNAKVLELYEPHSGPVLDDADASIVTPVAPQSLTDRVTELAHRKGKRQTG